MRLIWGGTGGDVGYGIAVDSSGNAYVTGITNPSDFPTLSPQQSAKLGNGDAFVTKLNPTGTALIYSTYLGGAGSDTAAAIAADSSGDAFVTGTTTTENFPTTASAFQQSLPESARAASPMTVSQINSDLDEPDTHACLSPEGGTTLVRLQKAFLSQIFRRVRVGTMPSRAR